MNRFIPPYIAGAIGAALLLVGGEYITPGTAVAVVGILTIAVAGADTVHRVMQYG